MKLHSLKSTEGSRHTKKRVGRGIGSGHGKTAGRGENGQKSRAGYSKKIGFEGGQNPLYKRIPKRGFKNVNEVTYDILNIEDLNKLNGVSDVTVEALVENKLIKNSSKNIKILGKGELNVKITSIEAHKVSKSAKEKLEKAGAKIVLV